MSQVFLLAILDPQTKHVVQIPAGGELERNFVQAVTAAIVRKGVGFLKSEAAVKKAIAEGITDVLTDLKQQTIYVAR